MVTMTFDAGGRTLYGTDGVTALMVLQSLGVAAFGMNCSSGPEHMGPMLDAMAPLARVPLIVKANAGLPSYVDGATVFSMTPEAFAKENVKLIQKGAALVGGCCGTTPEHIRALAEAAAAMPGRAVSGMDPVAALTTERRTWFFDQGFENLCVSYLDARKDPELSEDLADGAFDTLYDRMEDIADAEPELILVCVDGEGIDGKWAMAHIFQEMDLSIAPVAIASEHMETLEWGLMHYPGRALVAGTPDQQALAERYGAAFVYRSALEGVVD